MSDNAINGYDVELHIAEIYDQVENYTDEVRAWLETHGFAIEQLYGDRAGNPYTDASERTIFWARKR